MRPTKQHKTRKTKGEPLVWKQKRRTKQVADVVAVPVVPVVVLAQVVLVAPAVSVVALPRAVAKASVVPAVPVNR
jgi:hypothetical protein